MTLYTLENVASFRGMNVTNGEIDDYAAYDEALDSEGTVTVAGWSSIHLGFLRS